MTKKLDLYVLIVFLYHLLPRPSNSSYLGFLHHILQLTSIPFDNNVFPLIFILILLCTPFNVTTVFFQLDCSLDPRFDV
ncbi:hypothetical protein K7X08_023153 [Anisodus acutangulus]|uniref:Uncharacterized protein n=1 Tax=Anisodus acutangulus TaxID=402998 RepID=A0A9Q1LHW5_9SOLA|nr:hypothetical protein K7X08_023153 [Anisodus acutangulus]